MSADGDIVRACLHDECVQAHAALARLEAAREECERQFQKRVDELLAVMAQRDALAEALRRIDKHPIMDSVPAARSMRVMARAALAEAEL